jgi:hypothetical protein
MGKKMKKNNLHNKRKAKYIKIANQPIVHTAHSFCRWNESERLPMYSKFQSMTEANEFIQVFVEREQIQYLSFNFYLIADDIVAVLDVSEEKIVVISYYGSVTLTPALRNLDSFLRNIKKYGKMNLSYVS